MSESDLTALRWSARCNDDAGIGYLGPTVKRYGPLRELGALVASGLLRCEEGTPGIGRRNPDDLGYWITDAGRSALRAALSAPAPLSVRPASGGPIPTSNSHG